MGKIFTGIYKWLQRRPGVGISLIIIMILLTFIPISHLRFTEDITKVVPENKEKIQKISQLFSHARLMEKVVFVVSDINSDQQSMLEFAKQLTDSLRNLQPQLISEIQGHIPNDRMLKIYSVFNEYLPLFLNEADYHILDSLLEKENIEKAIRADYRSLMTPADFGMKNFIRKDPLSLTRLAIAKLENFKPGENFHLIDGYIFTKDNKSLILFVNLSHPEESSQTLKFEEKINRLRQNLLSNDRFKNVELDYFGAPMVAAANARQIRFDIQLTVSVAFILLLIIISSFFKSARAVFIIFTPAILGALLSIGLIAFFKPELSLISLGIGAVLLGISVDFALHIYAHFRDNGNIESIFEDLAQPILISSLTTAAAFASLNLLKSEVMGDLGIFLAISVVASALFSLTLFPHLLKQKDKARKVQGNWIDVLAGIDLSRNKYLIYAILGFTIFFLFSDKQVYFDQDLNKSNYMPDKLRQSEQHINRITGNDQYRPVFISSFGQSVEDALEKNEDLQPYFNQLQNDSLAASFVNISPIVPSLKTQKERIARWNAFREKKDPAKIKAMIIEAAKKYGFKELAFREFYDFFGREYTKLLPYDENPLYQQIARDYIIPLDSGTAVLNQAMVKKQSPERSRLDQIFEGSGAIVTDKLSFAQDIINGLKQGFDKLVFLSLGLVFLILLLNFGRIELAIISFLPVSISWLWIVGIMDLVGLQFNIFNVIILSFVFGLGIDYSIFYMRGLMLNHMYGGHNSKTFRASILLSVITSLIGIGVLIFAKHPAMRSIALMSVIGIFSIILITFTLIPLSFRWLVSYKKGKRQKVVTALDTFTSILFFLGFVSGSLAMTLLIPVFMIFPAPKRKKRDTYRYFIKVFSSYIYLHPTIPIKIINEHKENFKKPAIIIANHQSVIDIMLMLMLSNKILIVTNERVWKHWLWGAVLRYAQYYPAFAEFDDMQKRIEKKVKQGYSIMIFPEGTRSESGKIKRFHKGAFYLAQKLNVEILPILLHGVNECLRKGEFFLFTGKITMKIMPRIDLGNGQMGETIREQAKAMTRFYREEYENLRIQVARTDYYSVHLTRNYIYKGPILEWYFKVKFRMEKRYRLFDELIPRHANVYDLGCGYGFLSLMLGMISTERQITGVDFDEEKIYLAQNSAIKRENVNFVAADVRKFKLQQADIFLILDTLHYFPEEDQTELIKSCMDRLLPEGKIIIRDANKDIEGKHKGTELTEKLSTGIGFNKARFDQLHFVSENMIREFVNKNGFQMEIIAESKHLSNRIYVITKS